VAVAHDFEAARSARGVRLLEPDRAIQLLDHARSMDWYVTSIETYELDAEGHPLNADWSMLGPDKAGPSPIPPDTLNDIAERIFRITFEQGLRVLFNVWVAPRAGFNTRPA
jgi:hypothetical protein